MASDEKNATEKALSPSTAASSVPQPAKWTAPNGGLRAWSQVAAGFFLSMNSWGLINTFGVYQTYYYTTLLHGNSNSHIAWIGSTQGFLLCFATILAGFACDKGHHRRVLLFGGILVVGGMVATSFGYRYYQLLLAQGICVGIGSGACFITSVSVLPQWFTTRRALAIGLSGAGSSIGGVLYPIIFHELEPRIGFGWATRIIGFIALATLSFSFLTLRPAPGPVKHVALKQFFEPAAFSDAPYLLFCLAAFLSFIGLFIPFFYIQQYASGVAHLDATLSFYALPLLSVGSISGRVAPAMLANRFGALTVLAGSTAVSAVLAFVWLGIGRADSYSRNAAGIILFCLFYGFFSGAFVSLRTVIVVVLTREEMKNRLGARLGINAFCAAVGLLIGTPIAGLLVKQENGWVKLQCFCGGMVVVGSAFVMVAAVVARRQKC